MTSRFIDFDAARAERENEPLLLRAYGRDFELPGSMPASVLLDVLRMQADYGDNAEVTVKDAFGILRRILPVDVLDALTAREDFSAEDFVDLAQMVMQAYQGESPAAPNRAARRHPPEPTKSTPSRGKSAGSTPRKTPASPGPTSSDTGP
jgi:hypothetical protein